MVAGQLMNREVKAEKALIIAIVGFSGAGKTTLVEKLIPALGRRGFRTGTIKHHFHDVEMDKPGKDSWRHKQAGAEVSILSTPGRIGMVSNVDHDHDPQELGHLFTGVDIILAEGYKRSDHLKIEVFRDGIGGDDLLCRQDEGLLAVVTDEPIEIDVPVFSVKDTEGLADRIAGIASRIGDAKTITAGPG